MKPEREKVLLNKHSDITAKQRLTRDHQLLCHPRDSLESFTLWNGEDAYTGASDTKRSFWSSRKRDCFSGWDQFMRSYAPVKILRILETSTYRRVGSTKELTITPKSSVPWMSTPGRHVKGRIALTCIVGWQPWPLPCRRLRENTGRILFSHWHFPFKFESTYAMGKKLYISEYGRAFFLTTVAFGRAMSWAQTHLITSRAILLSSYQLVITSELL